MNGIQSLSASQGLIPQKVMENGTPAKVGGDFSRILGNAINQVNQEQIQSNQATQNLIDGKATNLHNVMIDAAKANISLTAAVEIRNKVIDAYQNVMRMQI